jgi:polysaccharide biosynthesis/export protein
LVEFADYSDNDDLVRSVRACMSFLKLPSFLTAMTRHALAMLAICLLTAATGCHAIDFYTPSLQEPVPAELELPRELSMVSLPTYRIQPPDQIRIETMKLVPRPSYRINAADLLEIRALGTFPKQPIRGDYHVDDEGNVDLRLPYGVVHVAGLTMEEAEAEITRSLKFLLKAPVVTVQTRSSLDEKLTGEYKVQPDGTINLRGCGMVYVAGKTVTEAREAVQAQLGQYFDSPQASVEVTKFNSQSYYVINEAVAKEGNMWRFPITGNETVLDAMGQVQQLTKMSSKTIWVARPAPGGYGCDQILPVNWDAIAHGGMTDTNYQILPGDRIYLVDDSVVATSRFIDKFAGPIERLLNIGSLGVDAARGAEMLGRAYNQVNHRHGGF